MTSAAVRLRAYGISLGLIAVMLWPLSFDYPDDGYPFSSYPMFAYGRETPVLSVRHVLAIGSDGRRRPVPPQDIGVGTVMQSLMTVSNAVGRGDAQVLCERVAARVARRRGAYGNPSSLEVALSKFDITTYFAGSREPVVREVVATCPVPGGT